MQKAATEHHGNLEMYSECPVVWSRGSLPVCTWAEPGIEDFSWQRWEEMADDDTEEQRRGRGCGDGQEHNARSEHAQPGHTEAGPLWLWGSDFEEPVCSSTGNWGTEEFSVCQELTNLFYRTVILCVVQGTWKRRVDNGGSTTDLATAVVKLSGNKPELRC